MSGESVRVAVRVRPLLGQLGEDCCVVQRGQPTVVVGGDENTTFTFDHAFGSDAAQHDIYCESAERLVDSFFDGFNATILAYGQTGSGKVRREVEGVTRRPHMQQPLRLVGGGSRRPVSASHGACERDARPPAPRSDRPIASDRRCTTVQH